MWARLLYRLRRATPRVVAVLASWQLSVVLMVVIALYYGLLAIWSTASPAHVVQNIARTSPFWLSYALLLINTGVCLWQRLPRLRSDPGMFLFHGAFFVLALGVALSLGGRREATIWVAEGETFAAAEDQILSRSSVWLPYLPTFSVQRITAEFWRDQMLFTRLEAELLLPDGTRRVTRINRPWRIGWSSFVRLSGFGYVPRYEISTRDGEVIDSAFVKMNLFPPGQRDHLRLQLFPHRLYLEIQPDYQDVDGTPATRSLNLLNPAVQLTVVRGKVMLGEALLVGDESFEFEGLQVHFPEIRTWGQFSVVTDPGVPLLVLSALLGVTGLVLGVAKPRSSLVPVRREGIDFR